jgi:putative hemin transport protein
MSITLQDDLAERRAALAAAEPRLYPRDLAARLGVTEAEIVALDEGQVATRLRPDWPALLADVAGLGEVMALTRNADAVHEKIGIYGAFEGNAAMGLFVGEAIDLRLFLRSWKHGWAIAPASEGGRASLQFYAGDGTAVHKIFTTANTDRAAWARLVAAFADPAPAPLAVTAPAAVPAEKPDLSLIHI